MDKKLKPTSKTSPGTDVTTRMLKLLSKADSRIIVLRGLVVLSLFVAAGVCGAINYTTLKQNEVNFAASQYKSISIQALDVISGNFGRMSLGTSMLAKAHSYANSDFSKWPFVSLDGFMDMAIQLGVMASLDNVLVTPVVQLSQRDDFIDFMREVWTNEPLMPDLAGTPQSVLGIWSMGETSPYPDFDGKVYAFPTKYDNILVPVFQATFSNDITQFVLGMNSHTNPLFGPYIDAVMDCVAESADLLGAQTDCAKVSDIVPLPVPTADAPFPVTTDLQAFITHPILLPDPSTNETVVVATVAGAVNWQTVLSRAVPRYVSGVDCVVHTSTASFTYTMVNGVPVFRGVGDRHDENYDEYVETIDLLAESQVTSTTEYTVAFYPNSVFFEVYETQTPLYTTIGVICIIIFCLLIFTAYDVATSNESTRKEVVLDTKRRFVRFISHEIRTPLNTVRLGLKLLEMELEAMSKQVLLTPTRELPDMITHTVNSWVQLTDDILGNSDSAVDVLNDLLNYDKIEMGTLRLEYSSVAIWNLVKKTSAAFIMQAKQKGIELVLQGDAWNADIGFDEAASYEQLRVVGDCTRIAQVLRNLMSNALKFTPETGVVTIRADWVTDGLPSSVVVVPLDQMELVENPRAGSIRIAVTDSGAGLSPPQLADICREGVQFNANQLQAGQGSGLGLYISKGLTEQHGGSLVVTSPGLGLGATFTMELPLFLCASDTTFSGSLRKDGLSSSSRSNRYASLKCKVHPATERMVDGQTVQSPAGRTQPSSSNLSDTDPLPRQKRVLVVDDADSNRKLLMRILKAKGYLVDGAVNGQEAVELYTRLCDEGEIVDAVLMDFEMPVLDGPSATKKIRELGCKCFIVGVTGNVLPADIEHFQRQGANKVLAKPLNVDVFESMFNGYRIPAAAEQRTASTGTAAGGIAASQGSHLTTIPPAYEAV